MKARTKPATGRGDPLLDEIRAVKQAVSARAGHDVAQLCRELRLDQTRSTRRIVHRGQGSIQGGKQA